MAVSLLTATFIVMAWAPRGTPLRWNGMCDVIPIQGCSCIDHFGPIVTCVDLGLTQFDESIRAPEAGMVINTLDLSGNAISFLGLGGAVEITHLVMNYNGGGGMRRDFFRYISADIARKIESVEVDNSGFTSFPDFSEGFNSLRKISIRNNDIDFFDLGQLTALTHLEELYISGNPINQVDFSVLDRQRGLESLRVLDVSWADNSVASGLMYGMGLASDGRIATLSISDSRLRSGQHNLFFQYRQLQSLSITGAEIDNRYMTALVEEYLMGWWPCYGTLQDVSLARNDLRRVPSDFIQRLPDLRHIDLSHNDISKLSGNIFGANPHLGYINLSYNVIRVIHLRAFHRDDIIEQIRHLDLSNNQLATLEPEVLPPNFMTETDLLLGHNPWSCGCDLIWLLSLVGAEAAGEVGPLRPYDIYQDLTCYRPQPLMGTLLLDFGRNQILFC